MKAIRTATIVELLPPECSKCEGMSMANERVRSIPQPITTRDQPIAQIPVFSRCPDPTSVKSAHIREDLCRKSEIARSEECRVVGVRVPTGIEIIDDELRGGGVRVIRKLVERPAAKHT